MAIDDFGHYYESAAEKAEKVRQAKQGTYVDGVYQPVVMASGDHAAAETTAAILRGNYENWKNTYFPKVSDLMNLTTYNNPDLVANETAAAAQTVNDSFANVKESQANNLARYGLSVDPTASRTTDLAQTAALAGAKNNTRTYLSDRDKVIASGGLPSAVAGGS